MTKALTQNQQNAIAGLAVAACSMVLTTSNELQLLPAGAFRARDGRPADAPGWTLDAALATALIAAATARGTPYVIDYEHQTLFAKDNGKPAPAAGWFSKLEWRDGVGLFAVDVEWTPAALAMIEAKEYRFSSPVIGYDTTTGAVNALYMAAITNNPAIDGMNEALLTAAALHFTLPPTQVAPQEIPPMNELLKKLCQMLGLPETTPEADVVKQVGDLIDMLKKEPKDPKEAQDATAAATFAMPGLIKAQSAIIASLSTATPDPAKYVPIAALQAVQAQAAQLSSQLNTGSIDDAIKAAMAAGKVVPAMEGWARDLGKTNFAALTAFIASAPVLVPLGTQTKGEPPGAAPGALTDNQVALCAAMGVSQDDFKKTLTAQA